MDTIIKFFKSLIVLTPEQKKRFLEYLPLKVYNTERNIAILVALVQLGMIALFLSNKNLSFQNMRSLAYFSLYVYLLITTCIAIVLYSYLVKNKKYKAFLWLRRIYAFSLCFWVIGITYLEQMKGHGISVYYYLLPTTSALLLLSPIESISIFAFTSITTAFMLLTAGNGNIFGDTVNSVLVTVLSLFISYRYYRSMAKEFIDRETIAKQYDEIDKTNCLLKQLVHVDQLTGLYNRHYLTERVYPMFQECKNKNYVGMFLMIDIDFFKQYNDLYGHVQGDDCLRRLADVIRLLCDEEDASAIRYGGEEFLIIKMASKEFDAKGIAQKLLDNIKNNGLERSDVEQKRVTASIGMWHNKLSEIEHIELGIRYADDALYEAKNKGRDCIVQVE